MSKPKQKQPSHHPCFAQSRTRSKLISTMTVVLVGVVAAVALLRGERGGFDTLNGRWFRPDGGYILDIRAVDSSGKIDAVYLNPSTINVDRAEAARSGSKLNVFVELRAPNYPGSTYTFTYDPEHDQLRGRYFHAALQQSFNVLFVRMKGRNQ